MKSVTIAGLIGIVTFYTLSTIKIVYYIGRTSGLNEGYKYGTVRLTKKLRESVEEGFNERCQLPLDLERIVDFNIKGPKGNSVLILNCRNRIVEYNLELSRVVTGYELPSNSLSSRVE